MVCGGKTFRKVLCKDLLHLRVEPVTKALYNVCMYVVQVLQDVKYLYNRELDLVYLTAKGGRGSQSASRTEIFLPLSTVSELTPAWIQKVQDILCADQEKKG
jgi:hypothetical protein